MTTPPFEQSLDLISDRSQALQAAARGLLDAPVPACPGWSGRELVWHLGEVQLFWAAVVAAGPAADPPPDVDAEPGDDLLGWAAHATARLVAELRAAGPTRGTWTWWGEPRTADAVARHQVQEAAVHGYDAQAMVGRPQPLPEAAALDGPDEFLSTLLPLAGDWPGKPGTVALAAEGVPDAWLVRLAAAGAQALRGRPDADAVIRGTPSDLLLGLYRRIGPAALRIDGDRELAESFLGWIDLE